jgi:hypothetical protein
MGGESSRCRPRPGARLRRCNGGEQGACHGPAAKRRAARIYTIGIASTCGERTVHTITASLLQTLDQEQGALQRLVELKCLREMKSI